MGIKKHRNVPSAINKAFFERKINAAFISSVTSSRCRCSDTGIVAFKNVYSVLLKPGSSKSDSASQTSNALAAILGLQGEVMIGDKALKEYLDGTESIDLANEWHKRTKLPFVFARLCYHEKREFIEKLAVNFKNSKIFIPQYILKREAAKRGIKPNDVRWYLGHINYNIDPKSKKALKIFLTGAKRAKLI
jgi:chorismate dehydratase